MAVLEKGIPNLKKHIQNVTKVYGLPAVVAINRFPTDTEAELGFIAQVCKELGVEVSLSEVFTQGSKGGQDLAEKVLGLIDQPNQFRFVYDEKLPITEKIKEIATKVYGAKGVTFSAEATKVIKEIEAMGFDNLPICVAKTQYSFSDNAKLLGAPEGFEITIRQVRLSAGAGFIVVMTGDIMTLPGLPKVPSSEKIDVSDDGVISGLF